MLPAALQRLPVVRRTAGRFPIAGELTPYDGRPRRVGIVVHAGKPAGAAAVEQLGAAAAELGWPAPTAYPTTASSFGRDQTAHALADGCDGIIACGGDGTVRMVAAGLAGTGVPLGIVPLGTGNIFARNLRLPVRARARAIDIALRGATAPVDIGIADATANGQTERHLFLVLTGMGHDAATALATREALKTKLGWVAYAESAARHALKRPVRMRLRYPANEPREIDAWSVIAGNCGRVPGGIEVFPGAIIDDGVLDVMEATVSNPLQWIPIGAKGLLHLRTSVPGLRHALTTSLSIEPAVPLPVQVDGDVIENVTRLDVSLDPRALVVRVPAHRV